MAKRLRLYVWHNVLTDYTDGVMFALASTAEEARQKVREAVSQHFYEGGAVDRGLKTEPEVHDAPAGFAVWGGG